MPEMNITYVFFDKYGNVHPVTVPSIQMFSNHDMFATADISITILGDDCGQPNPNDIHTIFEVVED